MRSRKMHWTEKGKEGVGFFGIVIFEKLELKSFQKVWEHIYLEREKRKRYSNFEGVPKHGENKFSRKQLQILTSVIIFLK